MHDHLHHHHPDSPDGVEEPLDTANQSLADALRASFNVLRVILVVVVVLYLCSGIGYLEQNEQGLVLRFGRLQDEVLQPGLHVLFPRPIDEMIIVPVSQKRTTRVLTQQMMLRRKPDGTIQTFEEAPSPGNTLDPGIHGTVMTGDRELIHAEWVVTYTISDLTKFVSNILRDDEEAKEDLIRVAVENAAIEVIGQEVAVDAVLNKLADVQLAVRTKAQETLRDKIGSGIQIATVVPRLYWPKNTKLVFDSVTKASNERSKTIDEAKRDAADMLIGAAGPVHAELEELFDAYMFAKARGNMQSAAGNMAQIDAIVLNQATGQAGERIREAESFRKNALEDIKADYNEYLSHLEEYRNSPRTLLTRLWTETQLEIMKNPNVTKRHLPAGQKEIRIQIGPDPEEKKKREVREYKKKDKKDGDFSKVKRGDEGPIIKPRPGTFVQ